MCLHSEYYSPEGEERHRHKTTPGYSVTTNNTTLLGIHKEQDTSHHLENMRNKTKLNPRKIQGTTNTQENTMRIGGAGQNAPLK